MRIIVVQPALPSYRVPFFSLLYEFYGDLFVVYASAARDLGVLNCSNSSYAWLKLLGPIRPFFRMLEWQSDILNISLQAGDVLVLCGQPRTLSNLFILAKAKIVGAHVVWWGQYWSSTSHPLRAAIRFQLMKLADSILLYSDQEVCEYLARNTRPKPVQVAGLNNGIKIEEICKFRDSYNANTRGSGILFIGRLTKKACLNLLLDAIAKENLGATVLHVVGDGDESENLHLYAEQLGIKGRVYWHGAIVKEEIISKIANCCSVFVYPGSVGLSLIHGLSYGLPAIIHDNRWRHMPEVAAFRDGINGASFRMGDANSLSDTIQKLLSQPQVLNEMSVKATETTAQTFNTTDMARRFIKFVGELR